MNISEKRALVWFRRDLRIEDHAPLYHALKNHQQVIAVFVFDTDILTSLPNNDRRLTFIYDTVVALKLQIEALGGQLIVLHDRAVFAIPELAKRLAVSYVYAAQDYEPAAIVRDQQIATILAQQNQPLKLVKDQVIFEKDEVLSQKGTPLTVFTPYKNAWLKKLNAFYMQAYPVEQYQHHWWASELQQLMPTLDSMGFVPQTLKVTAGMDGAAATWQDFQKRMAGYKQYRDFPAVKGVSYLSVHLRFGTISIRRLVSEAFMHADEGSATWLSELVWREFYMQFLWHHPNVAHEAFKAEWRQQPWGNRQDWFDAWCDGQTGYPIIDAAMRQLNQTGFMHNRLRMIVAAFLIKDLDINWQWGEAYFAQQLLDFDLSANNGGWQWASSTGCDAAQPFRIFNPILQSRKFDSDGKFIRKYVPELAMLDQEQIHAPWEMTVMARQMSGLVLGKDYPFPLVDHDLARKKALEKYALIKQSYS